MSHSTETKRKISESIRNKWLDKNYREKNTKSIQDSFTDKKKRKISLAIKRAWNTGRYKSRDSWKKSLKLNYLNSISRKYPTFFKVEQPVINLQNLTIKVRCKKCGKLFKPSYSQLYERIRIIENGIGFGENNFYCSDKCKKECLLYGLRSTLSGEDIFYTEQEYKTFRNFVLQRDNNICQFCGSEATDIHHERPQKLEPFFALDPDYAWSCCKECHYKYGHKDECSTGNLASKICI
jgi:hypothetical protein